MGLRVLDRLDFCAVAHPLLRELNLATREAVHLAILQGSQAISIDKFDSAHPVGLDACLGGIMPFHCTGVGKTILAHQSEEFLARIAQSPGFHPMTKHSLTTLPQLRKELQAIREQGFTVDQEEAVEGLELRRGPNFQPSRSSRRRVQRGRSCNPHNAGTNSRVRPACAGNEQGDLTPDRLSKQGRHPRGIPRRTSKAKATRVPQTFFWATITWNEG